MIPPALFSSKRTNEGCGRGAVRKCSNLMHVDDNELTRSFESLGLMRSIIGISYSIATTIVELREMTAVLQALGRNKNKNIRDFLKNMPRIKINHEVWEIS